MLVEGEEGGKRQDRTSRSLGSWDWAGRWGALASWVSGRRGCDVDGWHSCFEAAAPPSGGTSMYSAVRSHTVGVE